MKNFSFKSYLAIGSSAGLAGIDVAYVGKKRISPVYLVDALAETVFVVLWGFTLLKPGMRKSDA